MTKNKIGIILIVLFVTQLLFRFYQYRNVYLIPYNAAFWKMRYENSQWSTKPACANLDPHVNPYTCVWDDNWYAKYGNVSAAQYFKKNPIGDDGVYTYAGWEYIHGHDPTTLNAEIPPLGKYLIGLSEIVFDNQNFFSLFSSLFVLLAFYFLNTVIFKDKLLAFIPVFLFSIDPLYYTQLSTTLLDALYLGLLLFTFYFFFKRKFVYSAIFLGLMAATKSAASTFPLVAGIIIIYLVITGQKKAVIRYLLSLLIAFFVFVLTYAKYFVDGHTFREFLGVQKWIILFYGTGAKGSFVTPWEMIFTGRWHTWWGTDMLFYRWHIGWIFLIIATIYSIYFVIKNRYIKPVLLLILWVLTYLLFLSFIPTWPRYLLLVLPFMYNLAVWSACKFLSGKFKVLRNYGMD